MPLSSMPTVNGLQRFMKEGVPFWKNSDNDIFAYDTETPQLRLGTADSLLPNWKALYQARLQSYRDNLVSRPRSQKK